MKKIVLLLGLTMVALPAFPASYTVRQSTSIYTPRYSYTVTPRRYYRANPASINALWVGSALATGRLNLLATPALRAANPSVAAFLDPYIVNIDNQNYVLVKDSKNNEWSIENILGYGDSKDDLFASLKNLESDGDKSKISQKELTGIRFVKLNNDGSLALNERNLDYDINKVQYIDMKNLRTALGNKNQDGTFGYFYVIIKDNGVKRAVPGRVTFEEKKELEKYIN